MCDLRKTQMSTVTLFFLVFDILKVSTITNTLNSGHSPIKAHGHNFENNRIRLQGFLCFFCITSLIFVPCVTDTFGFKQEERFDCGAKAGDVFATQRRFPQALFWDYKVHHLWGVKQPIQRRPGMGNICDKEGHKNIILTT